MPATSTTFSTNNGCTDSLKPLMRCGLRPNFRQIRSAVDLLSPLRLEIEARDQRVTSRAPLLSLIAAAVALP